MPYKAEFYSITLQQRLSLILLLLSFSTFAAKSPKNHETASLTFCYEDRKIIPGFDLADGSPGFMVQAVERAAKSTGLKVFFIRRPWKRCIFDITRNQIDGLFPALWQADRQNWGQFPRTENKTLDISRRITSIRYLIWVHKDSSVAWNGKQFFNWLSGFSAPLGYVARDRLSQLGALSPGNFDFSKGLQLVATKRIDGYIADPVTVDSLSLPQTIRSKIKPLPREFLRDHMYLVLSHQLCEQLPETCEKLWNAVALQRVAIPYLRDADQNMTVPDNKISKWRRN